MATDDNDNAQENHKPILGYRSPPPPRPKPSKAELDRRERVAAFWILGFVVFAPFLLIAWFIWEHFFGR